MATIDNPQQLSIADRIAIRANIVDRCAGCVANYALYLLGLNPDTDPNAVNRRNWAETAVRNAPQIGDQVSWHVLNQNSFLNGGSAIDDDFLKSVVETAINNHFISPLTP